MTKPHNPLFLGESLSHPCFCPFTTTDIEKHFCHGLIGSAMERSLERPDRRRNGRVQIRHRRGSDAGGERGRVEFVFRVQRQGDVKDPSHGFRLIVPLPVGEEIEEVFSKAQVFPWSNPRLAVHKPIRGRNH